MFNFLIFSLFLFTNQAFGGVPKKNFSISKTGIYQADILVIQRNQSLANHFIVNFASQTHHSYLFEGKPVVLIGIHYQIKPGGYNLEIVDGEKKYFYRIKILERYPPKKYRVPERPQEVQKEVNKQIKSFGRNFEKYESKPLFQKHFIWPLRKIVVTEDGKFGADRCAGRKIPSIFCRYHTGTDFRAAFDFWRRRPENVLAINSGKVAEAGDYLSMGKVIVIDHGAGIFSGYLHLSKFLVKKGDLVRRGQIIGVAGNTGTTSIHLHLFIRMNNGKAVVDPESFFQAVKNSSQK